MGHGGGEGIKGIKSVISVLESRPSITPPQMRLARWMADYYISSLGIALRTMVPSVLSDTSREMVALLDGASGGRTSREMRVVEALRKKTPQTVRALRRSLRMGSIWSEMRSLASAGVVALETRPPRPSPVKKERVVRLRRWIEDLDELETLTGRARRQAGGVQEPGGVRWDGRVGAPYGTVGVQPECDPRAGEEGSRDRGGSHRRAGSVR